MEGNSWYHKAGSGIWHFFSSLKLTLFVLITLAAVSIIGTVVQQNLEIADYMKSYGPKWGKVILSTGLNDMYHSVWFLLLLAALALNIIVCTFERFPVKWKALLRHKSDKFDPKMIDKFTHKHTVVIEADAETVKGRLLKAFREKKYKVMITGSEGAHSIYAWKGIIGRFGSDMTHISLLLILIGAIVGSFYGYKDFKIVYVDGFMNVRNESFKIRLDKFWIDYYETGQIRQYNSLLTVIDGGREVLKKQIWVNEPLYYKGVRFYQSSYGMAWDRVADARVALKKRGSEDMGPQVIVKWDETAAIPNSPYTVKLVGYVADFAFDEKTKTIYSLSAEANNPAINLAVYNGGALVSTPWLFMKYPAAFPSIPNADEDLIFTLYRPTLYSGISINKDPGTNIVWAGAIVMGIGFYMAFFIYHRRLWVHIAQNGTATEVRMGGTVNKNNFVFERDLDDIIESIKAG